MRPAFLLLSLLFFLTLFATLTTYSFFLQSKTHELKAYQKISLQERLLKQSLIDFSLYQVKKHLITHNDSCINQIKLLYPNDSNAMFQINITLKYIAHNTHEDCDTLTNAQISDDNNLLYMLIDIQINSLDETGLNLPIKFHTRKLLKP